MGLDVRVPIGLMFLMFGPILIVVGVVNHTAVNWQAGAPMTAFGAVMLGFGWASQTRAKRAELPPTHASTKL